VLGYEPIGVDQLVRYVAARGPALEIVQWAVAYSELAPMAGIRTSIAWAQACHETGWFRFAGTARPEWNNPAGLGVTGPAGVGNRFPTKHEGVAAHLGHLHVYFGLVHPVPRFCDADYQRHPHPLLGDGHKRLPNDVREIAGAGPPARWAPNPLYGLDRAHEAERILVA
jgi:hypothetical protein